MGPLFGVLFQPEIAKFWMKREEGGDPGSSCKYNLFINDSGWRIIKDALSQWECVCFSELAYF